MCVTLQLTEKKNKKQKSQVQIYHSSYKLFWEATFFRYYRPERFL